MKIIWSPRATREVGDIAAYIAKDRPMAAEAWLTGAVEAVNQLKEFPESGRVVHGSTRPNLREIVYRKAYRIVYRIGKSAINVVTVRNFAQQFDPKAFEIDE